MDRARNAPLAVGQETIVMSSEERYLETLEEMLRAAESRNDPTLGIMLSPKMLRLLLDAARKSSPVTRPATSARSARQILDGAAAEDDLLTAIVEAALWYQWEVHHDRRSDKALQQGTPGFPDLVLARNGRVLFLELKASKGELSADQWAWLTELPNSRECSWSVVRPADLDALLVELA